MRPNENTNKEYQEKLDTSQTTDPTEFSKVYADINEIWLPDLADVDKLAKGNKDVKYLSIAVDCLSHYPRV